MLDKTILGFLNYKELTIYEIKKAFEGNVSFFYSASFGSLHPSIKKLELNGFINSMTEEENGRLKKIYSITERGKIEFHKWLLSDIGIEKIQDQGVLRLYFLNFLEKKERVEILKNYKTSLELRLEQLKNIEKDSAGKIKELKPEYKEIAVYQTISLDYGINYFIFVVKWYDDLIKKIEKGDF